MTDILERLRKPPFEMWETTERKLCEDAANEIERLRALSQNNAHSWDAIVQERNALRAALKEAINDLEHSGYCRDHPQLEKLRAALSTSNQTEPK